MRGKALSTNRGRPLVRLVFSELVTKRWAAFSDQLVVSFIRLTSADFDSTTSFSTKTHKKTATYKLLTYTDWSQA